MRCSSSRRSPRTSTRRRSGSTRLDQRGAAAKARASTSSPAEPACREARAAAAAGVHRACGAGGARAGAPTLAPGTPAGTIVSPPAFQPQTGGRRHADDPGGHATPAQPGPIAQAIARAAEGLGVVRNIQVVADKDNNTLLIVATRRIRGHRGGAEETRHPVAAGDDRGHDRERDAERRAPVRRRVAVQGRRAVRPRPAACSPATEARTPATCRRRRRQIARRPRAREGASAYIINNANLPRRRPGGAAPAGHVRRHQGHRQSAPRGARQPEGDDQGRATRSRSASKPSSAPVPERATTRSRRRRSTSTPACCCR